MEAGSLPLARTRLLHGSLVCDIWVTSYSFRTSDSAMPTVSLGQFRMSEVSAGLVSYGFENARDVPELHTSVWRHVGILGYLVQCRNGV